MPPRDPAKYQRERRGRLSDRLRTRLQLGDHLKKSYGLTLAEYDRLLASQEGRCAACRYLPDPGHRLHVDHDHETGAVRALLCGRCNTALGMMDENPLLLQQLAHYAEHCHQRRAAFLADPEDAHRHAIAEAYKQDPHVPYLVNVMREAMQRVYSKVTKSKRQPPPAAAPRSTLLVASVRAGDAHEAPFV